MEKTRNKLDYCLIILLILLSTAERIKLPFVDAPLYSVLFIPILCSFVIRKRRESIGRFNCDHFELLLLVWTCIGVFLTAIYGTGGDTKGLISFLIDIVILFSIYTYERDSFDYSFLVGILGGAILNIIVGMMELYGDGFHVVENFTETYERMFFNKAVGFQVNANDYCVMMVLYVIGLYYLLQKLDGLRKWPRRIIILSIGFSVFILIRDFSRAAVIALIFALFYIVMYKVFGREKWHIIAIIFLIVGGSIFVLSGAIETRFSVFIDNRSDTERVMIYSQIWDFAKQHYFIGVGAGNTTRMTMMSPHNLILELVSDYGIVVTILFLKQMLPLLRYKKERDHGNGYHLIALFGICFLFGGISSSSIIKNRICWVFFAYFCREAKRYRLSRESDLEIVNQ